MKKTILILTLMSLAIGLFAQSLNVTLAGRAFAGTCHTTFTVSDHSYRGIGGTFILFNIYDLTDHTEIGHRYTRGTSQDICVVGDNTCLSDLGAGLSKIVVSTPSATFIERFKANSSKCSVNKEI